MKRILDAFDKLHKSIVRAAKLKKKNYVISEDIPFKRISFWEDGFYVTLERKESK